MEFLLLVLVNIILATIFYLVIRLKLEKTASGYREKKLKREIDEIISEFNEVAERNISILENRIAGMKRLLEKSGGIQSVDIQIDDKNDLIQNTKTEGAVPVSGKLPELKTVTLRESVPGILYNKPATPASFTDIIKEKTIQSRKVFLSLKGIIINKYQYYKNSLTDFFREIAASLENSQIQQNKETANNNTDEKENDNDKTPIGIKGGVGPEPEEKNKTIVKNLSAECALLLSEGEISEMFIKTDDKYLLISELFHKGYSAKIITKCSGIPMGEVKLVLDLNDSL